MTPARAWLLASRPKTLPAAVVPVAVGAAVAHHQSGRVDPVVTLTALLVALLLQIGSNFANDVFDYEKGADAERVGPTRAVQAGWVTPAAMKRVMWGIFALAFGLGLYLAAVGGVVVLLLGVLAILSAVAYTGGPYPLGYHGLGDLFVMLFFGFVAVCTTSYLNLGTVPSLAWFAAIPVGALATAILVVNNVRDGDTDARVGKRTLVVRWGRRGGIAEFTLLLGLAFAVPPLLLATQLAGGWVALPLLTIPKAIALRRELGREQGSALNHTLAKTAQLLALYGALLTAGLYADRLWGG